MGGGKPQAQRRREGERQREETAKEAKTFTDRESHSRAWTRVQPVRGQTTRTRTQMPGSLHTHTHTHAHIHTHAHAHASTRTHTHTHTLTHPPHGRRAPGSHTSRQTLRGPAEAEGPQRVQLGPSSPSRSPFPPFSPLSVPMSLSHVHSLGVSPGLACCFLLPPRQVGAQRAGLRQPGLLPRLPTCREGPCDLSPPPAA